MEIVFKVCEISSQEEDILTVSVYKFQLQGICQHVVVEDTVNNGNEL